MAGAAGYTNTIWPNESIIIVIARIIHEARPVPLLACLVVELRVGEKPETEHSGGFAVNFVIDPGRLGFDLLVEPEAILIGP
jgi:hypothetical protein